MGWLADAFGTRIVAHFAALAGGPQTIVHGDYRGDNVLFGRDSQDDLAVIDWQGCGIGCGMYDVAFLLGTSVSIDPRRRLERDLVDEYHDIVCRVGARNFTRDDCWRSSVLMRPSPVDAPAAGLPGRTDQSMAAGCSCCWEWWVSAAGSILLGFSGSINQVVGFRAVQGAGGGTIMTCCYVAVVDLFRPAERGKFHGLLSAVNGVSFVAGPILGGVLADALSWQWAFLVIGLAGIPVVLLTARVYPKPASSPVDRDLDLKGMVALALAVPPLLIALSFGGAVHEWRSPPVLGMLLFSLAMTGVFVAVEARARSPITQLSLTDSAVSVAVAIML